MGILLLMRHGSAAFPEPGETDFQRALTPAGEREARMAATQLAALGLLPDRTICSTALRARQTLDAARQVISLEDTTISHEAKLYSDSENAYFAAMRAHGDVGVLLLVGHNPMLEECALALCEQGDEASLQRLREGFPTGAIAVINLADTRSGTGGSLEQLIEPL